MKTPPRGQEGMALVAAIFVVVALGVLGLMALRVGTTQQVAGTGHLQGSRAYYAARSGVEWGVYQALQEVAAGGASNASVQAACTGSPALGGFAVTVTCSSSRHWDPTPRFVVAISATARAGVLDAARQDLVQRTVRASIVVQQP